MPSLNGPISSRLRKIFAASDPAWNPGRPASPAKATKTPKHVEGHSITGRKGKKK